MMTHFNSVSGDFPCRVLYYEAQENAQIDDPRTVDLDDRVKGRVHAMRLELPDLEKLRMKTEDMPFKRGCEVRLTDENGTISAFVISVTRTPDRMNPRISVVQAIEVFEEIRMPVPEAETSA